jgi:hypothetical protein
VSDTRFAFLGATGNHSGLRAPVAFSSGPISPAIRSGAASTFALIQGSFSNSANAAPSPRTFGPKAHIQPKPRGRRSSGGIACCIGRASSTFETDGARTAAPSVSPASIRRISADSARNLADIQPCAIPRSTGEIGSRAEASTAPGPDRARSATGRATRRTTAFTRSSRVTRNGAENIVWSFF